MPPYIEWALKPDRGINIPKRYDASTPPVPDVKVTLLGLFDDKQLDFYVAKALQNNPNLKSSLARLEESGFEVTKAKSSFLPALDVNGSASSSQNSFRDVRSREERYALGLDAQWEIDVWGRIRAGVRATARNRDALLADHASARQSIAAQTMQAYFDLVAEDQLLELSQRRLDSFEQTFQLVERRFESGTEDLGDLDLARTDLENTRAQFAVRQNLRARAARQLALLCGIYPDAKSAAGGWPVMTRGVQVGLPSTLFLNRPDIDAAYQRIRAADSNVKVAHRDIYPRFSLTASGGGQSSTLKDIADSNFSVWSIAGNLAAPIFDGGRRKAEWGAANARAKEAWANYQATVLNAFREVENALGSEVYLYRQEQSLANALKAARSAESRIRRNYETGLTEILTLLDTQRRAFNTEQVFIDTKAMRYKNRVTLALALGKDL
ncbi:MAG: efflux transporter outer membrane subunit [Akkermansiaceae bacterium]